MSVRINPAVLRAELERIATPALERGAIALLGRMEQNIQAGERSGTFHPENLRQSSAPGEYPQEQSGDLLASLDWRKISSTRMEVGAINNPPEQALKLETDTAEFGGRRWASRTAEELETHDAIQDGVRG